MKNCAALSFVLAPAGTAIFWLTQAGWAIAAGMSHTEGNAPVRTVNVLFIFCSRMWRVLIGSTSGQTVSVLLHLDQLRKVLRFLRGGYDH